VSVVARALLLGRGDPCAVSLGPSPDLFVCRKPYPILIQGVKGRLRAAFLLSGEGGMGSNGTGTRAKLSRVVDRTCVWCAPTPLQH
jgi:hypothetical protein